ncbi:MAG TPA: HAD-IA family hydrolase [Actinocrinis sp.]|nr:HAD-IA family hydrolase [Actinocrinis sp.]
MSSYRGLILDFGGVLTTSVPACAAGFERREGLTAGTLMHLIGLDPAGRELFADLERGAISQTEWNARTGELLGIDGADLLRRALADLAPEPSVIEAAGRLRAAGVRVGILSNSTGLDPFNPYLPWRLEENFDAVLISEHYRMRKPDLEIYTTMLGLMGLPAEECVFVDDTRHNLPPAQSLGMAVILAADPEATVARLAELFDLPLMQKPSGRQ